MVDRYMAQIDLKPLQDKTRVSGAFQVRRVSGEKVRLVVELCVCDTEQRRVLVFYPGLTSVFCRLQVFNANNELAYVNLSLDLSCEANKDIHPTTCIKGGKKLKRASTAWRSMMTMVITMCQRLRAPFSREKDAVASRSALSTLTKCIGRMCCAFDCWATQRSKTTVPCGMKHRDDY